ncbi:MAG: hypothetical protein Q8J89_14455 [Caulobacter sp.]|nr:hypothetical protein [Caulobacter sp.]
MSPVEQLAAFLNQAWPYPDLWRDPAFAAAAPKLLDAWQPRPGLAGEACRLLRDMGRFAACAWSLQLEATPGGLTVSRMSDALLAATVSGPGRARALLLYLQFIGYIEPAMEAKPRELRFRTTPRLRSALKERVAVELEARAALDPAINAVLVRLDETFVDLLVTIGAVNQVQLRLRRPRPSPLDLFSQRYAGMNILADILLAGRPEDPFAVGRRLPISVSDIARNCGTSRMQVAAVLKGARATGLLVARPDGGEQASETLLNEVRALLSGTTELLAGACRIVLCQPLLRGA